MPSRNLMEPSTSSISGLAGDASSSRGTDRGGRSTFRGGRGSSDRRGRGHVFSHGSNDAFRGRGRCRGSACWRSRGDGQREGRGFVSRKFRRHRSLSGKRGSYKPGEGEAMVKREKKDQKPNSNFALLYSMLGDAATIAEYIRDYHSSEKFRDAKSVNTFLQAVSQRPKVVYEELMSHYKDEVFTALERLFALYALGKTPITPPAHEFLIRCEQEGVRKSGWSEGVRTLPANTAEAGTTVSAKGDAEGVAPPPPPPAPVALPMDTEAASLLSPRELLSNLASLDAVGRLQRLIEMARTVDDIQVCAKKLTNVLTDAQNDVQNGNQLSRTSAEKFDYAAKCQLISKLLSKARRVVEPAFALPPKATTKGTSGDHVDELAGEATARQEQQVPGGDGDAVLSQTTTETTSSAASGTGVATATPVVAQRRDPLTKSEIAGFQVAISVAFHALETVLTQRLPSVTQQPLSKFAKMLEWCKERSLLAAEDERFATLLEQQAEKGIAEQANQIETVINIKSLAAGDTDALREVVNQLWEAGGTKCLSPSSQDVLSAIAVAASVEGIAADVKRMVADRLLQTQCHLTDAIVLPRRALRFVNGERNKVKQAAIAKQLLEEAGKDKTEHDA
ncbi:hypothetical protein LPMP_355200 [Leishmania panamensis]|uniref:Uncharacterized protein n=1 Tax=Leishmania panamensis TaxID=5679 RepID=A0A088S3C7_LEIPA|nr:hypothetical protein LPMP_355200 [Leishmania panamensis]AIO02651.1 hypothetical protein LPMP_355200 [Leishmania panamensis]